MGEHWIPENHLPPHESEKLDMTTSETWEDFESALTSVLLDLEEREMITIKLAGGKVPFIQFAGLGSLNGVDEIRAEFSAENVKGDRGASTTFTPEQRDYFTQAGFAVAKEGLVWRRGYPWPTPSQTILDVVAACITRLRDIAGINSPQQLCYMEAYAQATRRPAKPLVRAHLRMAVNKPHGLAIPHLKRNPSRR